MRFRVYEDKKGEWRWRLRARNGKIIATSAEGYKRKRDARAGVRLVREYAPRAMIEF